MKEGLVADILFTDLTRRAKRRSLQILNAKSKKARVKPYKDLLKITGKTVSYSKSAAAVLESYGFTDTRDMALAVAMLKDFEELIPLAEKVIDQTTRRILHDEKVPAQEKIFSIFEPHTDYYYQGPKGRVLWPQSLLDWRIFQFYLRLFDR